MCLTHAHTRRPSLPLVRINPWMLAATDDGQAAADGTAAATAAPAAAAPPDDESDVSSDER